MIILNKRKALNSLSSVVKHDTGMVALLFHELCVTKAWA